MSATRRRNKVVILYGPAVGPKPANHLADVSKMISRALSVACKWLRCNCTPCNILRALFSANVSLGVCILCVCAMWWHNLVIDDTIAAQEAVGLDGLCALPWGIVWAIRATCMPITEEGGDL